MGLGFWVLGSYNAKSQTVAPNLGELRVAGFERAQGFV